MKAHLANPNEAERTRCGTVVTERTQIVAGPDRVTCRRCQRLEAVRTRRFGILRYELEAALQDAHWLRDADRGTVAVARSMASRLDAHQWGLDEAADKLSTSIARDLTGIYRSLGLTPDGRPEHLVRDRDTASPLALLRGGQPQELPDDQTG